MIDRFGKLPSEVENLLAIIEIKLACITAGVAKLEAGRKGALISFQADRFANPQGLMEYIERLGARAKIRPDQKLFIAADWGDDRTRLKGALTIASALAKLAAGARLKPQPGTTRPAVATPAKQMPARPAVFRSKLGKTR
jgi:transcription-repair coupling factor (superfamily II helicase)